MERGLCESFWGLLMNVESIMCFAFVDTKRDILQLL